MSGFISLFNSLLTKIFGVVLCPVASLPAVWALAAFSLVSGILMLLIFGKVSNQEAIRRVRDQIRGNLIAVRLFQDDIGILMTLQARIMKFTLTYMRYSLVPMLIMMIPMMLILIQLNLRFSSRPLAPGEQAVVKVKARNVSALSGELSLQAPDGVVVETPAIRMEPRKEAAWRIRAEKPGRYELGLKLGAENTQKEIVVGSNWQAVSATRTGKNAWEMLLSPGESSLAAVSPIESIQINYPPLKMPIFGWNISWLIQFFILSILFGFAFKGVFKVEV